MDAKWELTEEEIEKVNRETREEMDAFMRFINSLKRDPGALQHIVRVIAFIIRDVYQELGIEQPQDREEMEARSHLKN
jgi:hypothetical protein